MTRTVASCPTAKKPCSQAGGGLNSSSNKTTRSPRRTASTSTWRLYWQATAPRAEENHCGHHSFSKHPVPAGLREQESRQLAVEVALAAQVAGARVAGSAAIRQERCKWKAGVVALLKESEPWLKRCFLVCSSLL